MKKIFKSENYAKIHLSTTKFILYFFLIFVQNIKDENKYGRRRKNKEIVKTIHREVESSSACNGKKIGKRPRERHHHEIR
jgi:hypothetical protein